MRPCTVFCADSNESNYNITVAKSGQTSLLKVYLKICRDSMQQILTNIQTAIIFLQSILYFVCAMPCVGP